MGETNFTIQAPLLVFDRVHRRTGTIERTCLFVNRKAEDLDLEIGYDFPEHSWVQLYGGIAANGDIVKGTGLRLGPGENRVVISLNTNNFNFPEGRFHGRITFREKGAEARESVEINFEDVDDLRPFPGFAGVDIGTSTSTISLYHLRREAARRMPWTPRQDGADLAVPSAVFIRSFPKFSAKADGGCAVGEGALGAYRSGTPKDPRCLQLGTKRLIGGDRMLVTDEMGTGGFVEPLDVLYALGRHLRERFQNHPQVRALIGKVSVTYPPTWSYRQISRWKELFRQLGFRDEDLDLSLDEASAAGLFYIYKCLRDRDSFGALLQDLLETEMVVGDDGKKARRYTLNLLSFDFGGGTIDIALLEAQIEVLPAGIRLRLSLRGSDSCEYGGDQVTLAVFRILKRRMAMAIANPSRIHEERAGGARQPPVAVAAAVSRPPTRHLAARLMGHAAFVLPDAMDAEWSGPTWDPDEDAPDASARTIGENWGYLSANIAAPRLENRLEDAVEDLFPTRFLPSDREIFRLPAKRNFDWLWERAEDLKKRLFDEVHRENGNDAFPSFDCLKKFRAGISISDVPDPAMLEGISWAGDPGCETIVSVGADEVFRAIEEPLEEAMRKVERMTGDVKVHRVALSGQSSKIPVVRWMLARPRHHGGLGIPPAKIDFDEANAKSAVSKGACLLHILRETLVGYEVDIADFKANLLSDIFYLGVDGGRKVIFGAGPIDDLSYHEEVPEAGSFPRYLSVFAVSEDNLIGQFLFGDCGEALPAVPATAGCGWEGAFPAHAALLQMREKDRPRYVRAAAAILEWSDRQRIAWMEKGATPGSPGRPIFRFYITRNHALFAVRDDGGGNRLFEIRSEDAGGPALDPESNPFSGIH